MHKELILLSVMPTNINFGWQLKVQLHNFRKFGYSDKYHVLLYKHQNEGDISHIEKLEKEFPEVKFHYYQDTKGECQRFIQAFTYESILRPWTLKKHFEIYPELKDKAIFYTDQDVLFIKYLDFSKFQDDDINYLSWTGNRSTGWNYISYSYLVNKVDRVRPDKLFLYKERNPLGAMYRYLGIDEEFVKNNDQNIGGAQYILKNIDSKFWADMLDNCLFIRNHLMRNNQLYMEGNPGVERENNGWQSWCADMWSIVYTLWKKGAQTSTPIELDFIWATDPIEKADTSYLYHHAGQHELTKDGTTHSLFNKRKKEYVSHKITPFEDLEYVNTTSKDFCARIYADAILNII